MIKLHSYFPQIDFYLADPVFSKLYDLSVVRLSVADTLDAYLSQKYKNIQMRYSKKQASLTWPIPVLIAAACRAVRCLSAVCLTTY